MQAAVSSHRRTADKKIVRMKKLQALKKSEAQSLPLEYIRKQ